MNQSETSLLSPSVNSSSLIQMLSPLSWRSPWRAMTLALLQLMLDLSSILLTTTITLRSSRTSFKSWLTWSGKMIWPSRRTQLSPWARSFSTSISRSCSTTKLMDWLQSLFLRLQSSKSLSPKSIWDHSSTMLIMEPLSERHLLSSWRTWPRNSLSTSLRSWILS